MDLHLCSRIGKCEWWKQTWGENSRKASVCNTRCTTPPRLVIDLTA